MRSSLLIALALTGCQSEAPTEADLAALQGEVAQLRTDLEAARARIDELESADQGREDRLAALEASDSSQDSTLDDHAARLATAESDVDGVDARLATVEQDYATLGDLGDYVTADTLSTTLSDHVTTGSLSTTLSDYVTADTLSTTLSDHVTTNTLSTTLDGYVTDNGLSTQLGDYVTTDSLSTQLGDYVEADTLSDYATTTALEGVAGELSALERSAVTVLPATPAVHALTVPDDYETIAQALASLDGVRIPAGVVAEVRIAPGTYRPADTLRIEHPDGARIHLVGQGEVPEDVVLQFEGAAGVGLADGQSLGLLHNVHLQGDGTADLGESGIALASGATLHAGDLLVSDFGRHGIEVRQGAAFLADHGIPVVRDNLGHGVCTLWGGLADLPPEALVAGSGARGLCAVWGGLVDAAGVSVQDSGQVGVLAKGQSFIQFQGGVSRGNGTGVYTLWDSLIWARGAGAYDNDDNGFVGQWTSQMSASQADAAGNGAHDYRAALGSYVEAQGATTDGGGFDEAGEGSVLYR